MAIVLDVTLISGRKVSLESDLDASVESVSRHAGRALGVGKGRLLNSLGGVLDGDASLETAGLQTGDSLTLQVGKVQICGATVQGFAAILGNGSAVTWGPHCYCNAVQDQLKNVEQIQATAVPLPLSWAMGLLSPGVCPMLVATAVLSKTS